MSHKLKRNLMLALAAGGFVYVALIFLADYQRVAAALTGFSWWLFPLLLLLSYLNYLSRALKWHYYLRLLGIALPAGQSLQVFMCGLVMSVTPGKMGELLKTVLVKDITGTPVSTTAPIILAERITDFISLVLIGIVGAIAFGKGTLLIAGTGVFFICLSILLAWRGGMEVLLRRISGTTAKHGWGEKLRAAYESCYTLVQVKPLLLMTLLSLVSWFFECLGYYIILSNFRIGSSLLWAAFSYSFATIAGAITMLPGGLGVTDGSLTVLQTAAGAASGAAAASTLIIRIVTLWFAVVVGAISMLMYHRHWGTPADDSLYKDTFR